MGAIKKGRKVRPSVPSGDALILKGEERKFGLVLRFRASEVELKEKEYG